MPDINTSIIAPPDQIIESFPNKWDEKTFLSPRFERAILLDYPYRTINDHYVDGDKTLSIPEIFVQAVGEKYILYSPLAGVVAEVNADAVQMLAAFKSNYPNPRLATLAFEAYQQTVFFLQKTGLLRPASRPVFFPRMYRRRIDLFLTSDCNLRCVYCFASAGERPRHMSWDVAKTAIDFTVNSIVKRGRDEPFEVVFQGNGEPFMAWPMMKRCVAYARSLAKQYNLHPSIRCVTNGYLAQEMVQWAVEHLDHLYISLDGPADVQNMQRPMNNGSDSAQRILDAIRFLDQKGASYSLRATISPYNVNRISELVSYILANFPKAEALHIEPLFPTSRSRETNWDSPKVDEFINGYVQAWELANQGGLPLVYAGYDPNILSPYHCDPAGIKIAITPEGLITLCPEVSTLEDQRADIFIYGQIDPDSSEIRLNTPRLRRLMARTLKQIPFCDSCMVRWHCGGECLSKNMIVGELNNPEKNFRCMINRELFSHQLQYWLENKRNVLS